MFVYVCTSAFVILLLWSRRNPRGPLPCPPGAPTSERTNDPAAADTTSPSHASSEAPIRSIQRAHQFPHPSSLPPGLPTSLPQRLPFPPLPFTFFNPSPPTLAIPLLEISSCKNLMETKNDNSDLGKAQPQLSDWSYLAMLNKFNRNWDEDFYHLLKWTPTCQKYIYHIKVFSIFILF